MAPALVLKSVLGPQRYLHHSFFYSIYATLMQQYKVMNRAYYIFNLKTKLTMTIPSANIKDFK